MYKLLSLLIFTFIKHLTFEDFIDVKQT
jgi:hypothetical protein